jgi:predicted ABC-type ATPase
MRGLIFDHSIFVSNSLYCNKKLPTLFIIAGCNGAGKTTASYTVLPELLNVREFVNADEIAKGLSPFQPEKVSIEAGKIMLKRIDELIVQGQNFAFETTLASRIFVSLCSSARQKGYAICLTFLWLDSKELAIERVKQRVLEGGHNIPTETIIRRYSAGQRNFFNLYKNIVDFWLFIDNSKTEQELIAEGKEKSADIIYNKDKWTLIQKNIQDENS